jgi:endonuclease/exonuclease/phosphatase family metal-dependent hydrolase
MRFVLYNIRYGTGGRRRLPWSGYFGRTESTLFQIIEFLQSVDPDVLGLVEVDAGSYRSGKKNQAQTIAEALGHYHIYSSKYSQTGAAHLVPVLNKQGNAFVSRDSTRNETFHYFDKGMKRLVIELELENLTIFLVHLALSFRVRHHQLSDLYDLVKHTDKPHLVAGDFNARWGDREINLFLAATGLATANTAGLNSFPSWLPKRQLDFVLHSPGVRTTGFSMPGVTYSDHLPLVYDFEIDA